MNEPKSTAGEWEIAPSREQIRNVWEQHVEENLKLPMSAVTRDLGSEESLVRDYSGRAVFELLQNALSPAEERISVCLMDADGERDLLVANDGAPLSVERRIDGKRSDFHALCSLHSSNKSADEHVGNKGIGFRSVFSVSETVDLYSRTADRGWWRLGMRHPVNADWARNCLARISGDVDTDVELPEECASFYFPDVELEVEPPPGGWEEYSTVVVLKGLSDDAIADAVASIELLSDAPLFFLKNRVKSPEELRIELQEGSLNEGASESGRSLTDEGWAVAQECLMDEGYLKQAREAGLDLSKIEVCVGIPLKAKRGAELTPRFYSYFPTEELAGFGAHIHADFYLNNSRRSVVFEGRTGPPQYNGELLEHVVGLIVDDLWNRRAVVQHPDFWSWCTPEACENKSLRDAVFDRLFVKEDQLDCARWVKLVQTSFDSPTGRPLKSWRDFWQAVHKWAHRAYKMGFTSFNGARRKLIEVLMDVDGARILPLPSGGGQPANGETKVPSAIVLPPRPQKGKSARGVVFVDKYASEREHKDPAIPKRLQEERFVVTSFDPDPIKLDEAGLQDFSPPEVLRRFPTESFKDHGEEMADLLPWLLGMAKTRYGRADPKENFLERAGVLDDEGTPYPWWGFHAPEEANRNAYFMVFQNILLPVLDNEWAPARRIIRGLPEAKRETRALAAATNLKVLDVERLTAFFDGNRDDANVMAALCGVSPLPRFYREPDQTPVTDVKLAGSWNGLDDAQSATTFKLLRQAHVRGLDRLYEKHEEERTKAAIEVLRKTFGELEIIPADSDELCVPGHMRDQSFIAPVDIWLQSRRQSSRLKDLVMTVGNDVSMRALLWLLGARELTEGVEPGKVLRALRHLVDLHESPAGSAPGLVAQYRALVQVLETDRRSDAPRLVYRWAEDRDLSVEWLLDEAEPVYYPAKSHYRRLREFFPGLAFTVLREGQGEMGMETFQPEVELYSKGYTASSASRDILAPYLGAFVALAQDVQRQNFNEQAIRKNWLHLELSRVDDAWLVPRIKLNGTWNEGEPIGAGTKDDAFCRPTSHDEGPEIVFDFDADDKKYPFGVAISEALLGTREIAAHAERLLARAKSGNTPAIEDALHRFGISPKQLADWEKTTSGWILSEDQRVDLAGALLEKTGAICELEVSEDRLLSSVGQDNISKIYDKDATAQDLETAIRSAYEEVLGDINLAPTVRIDDEHRMKWRRKRKDNREEALARRVARVSRGEWTDQLREAWTKKWAKWFPEGCKRLAFELEDGLEEWSRRGMDDAKDMCKPDPEPMADAEVWARGGLPVASKPITQVEEACRTKGAQSRESTPQAPESPHDRDNRQRRQSRRGAGAEIGVLHREKAEVDVLLQNYPARALEAIQSALPEELDWPDDLEHNMEGWMRVSERWGNAGYDILSLREEHGEVHPFRIEVKRGRVGEVDVHLSENERRQAARYLSAETPGDYELWLVTDDGSVHDITPAVKALIHGDVSVHAKDLAKNGYQSEGWMFTVKVQSSLT